MTRSRLGLLGLCAMVLGLMAFGATGAQAEGTWLILNSINQVKTGTELPAIIELEKESSVYVLHSKIIGIAVLFLCTELKAVNAKIFGAGAVGKGPGEEKGSKVLFSGCTTDLNGAAAPECTPKDATEGVAGTILTKEGHALVVLHEGQDITKVLPDEGETFATIEMGATCPIGTKVPVIGSLALKDCENLALTHLVKHLVEPFEALTQLWTISKTEEHKATLLGSAWAKLGGEHTGLKWSISGV
jgi:hypothetical protein